MREKIVVRLEFDAWQRLEGPTICVCGIIYDEEKGIASIGGPKRYCEAIMLRIANHWVESTGLNPWMHRIVMHKTVSQSRFKRTVEMGKREWTDGVLKLEQAEQIKRVRNMRRVMR
jgi:hypothetical protein